MAEQQSVLMLLPSLYGNGGIQRFNRTLLQVAEQCGAKITACSLVDSTAALQGIEHHTNTRLIGTARNRLRFILFSFREIVFGRWDDIVIGHINLVVAIQWMLKIALYRPRVFLIAHGIEIWGQIHGWRRRAVAACSRVLAVSSYTRSSILQQVPELPPDRCMIFPNALAQHWIDLQSSISVAGARMARHHRPLPERFVLSVTRLAYTERYKGIVSTIECVSGLQDASIHYVVAGKGDDVDFLKRVAKRCGVAERVHFISNLTDAELAELYRHALAFVLPSGKEGFGIVYLEAMHFGLPVIAARARGAVDVVRDGETGLLVEYGDVAAISGAINRIADDEVLRTHLIKSGKRLVTCEGEFTVQAMMQRWNDVIAN